jgi:hypothetical protein
MIDVNSSAPSTYGFLLEYIVNINATQQPLNAQKSYKNHLATAVETVRVMSWTLSSAEILQGFALNRE